MVIIKTFEFEKELNNEYIWRRWRWWWSSTGTQTSIAREAPGVEARKLALYDEAANLAKTPVHYQVFKLHLFRIRTSRNYSSWSNRSWCWYSYQGIAALQAAQAAPNISSFLNPYQSYVTDEITRQAGMAQIS